MSNFLEPKKTNNTIYLNIYEGMLCQRRASEMQGYEKYESRSAKTKGKVSYVKQFESLTAYLTSIKKETKETKDGSSKYVVLQFSFENEHGDKALLEVNAKDNFVAEFAKRVESIDLFAPITFGVFWGNKTNSTVIWFKQGDGEEKLPSNYTKDNPNGLPQWVKDETLDEWDSRDYWKFLYALIAKHATEEKLLAVSKAIVKVVEEPADDNFNNDVGMDNTPMASDDEIPF